MIYLQNTPPTAAANVNIAGTRNLQSTQPDSIEKQDFGGIAKSSKIVLSQPILDILSTKSLMGLPALSANAKRKKILSLVVILSEKFPGQLADFLQTYGIGITNMSNTADLRSKTIALLINNAEARKEFASLVTNLSMDLSISNNSSNFSNFGEEDFGREQGSAGEPQYAAEDEKTFFGKLWESVKDPLADVFGGLFKPGNEQSATSEAEKLKIQLEQQKLEQQKQMTNIIVYSLIGIGVLVIGYVIYKSSQGKALPASTPELPLVK